MEKAMPASASFRASGGRLLAPPATIIRLPIPVLQSAGKIITDAKLRSRRQRLRRLRHRRNWTNAFYRAKFLRPSSCL